MKMGYIEIDIKVTPTKFIKEVDQYKEQGVGG